MHQVTVQCVYECNFCTKKLCNVFMNVTGGITQIYNPLLVLLPHVRGSASASHQTAFTLFKYSRAWGILDRDFGHEARKY